MIKSIILGIDGGCFESIKPLLKNNLLPNFKNIIEKGFSADLIETLPPITIPSWPCLFSGLNPDQLGYCWFDHSSKGFFNSSVWSDKSIFSLKDFKSFILNVPGTYPAWKINGEMIAGMLSPSLSCYPAELKFFLKNNWIIDGKTVSECFKAFEIKKRIFLKKMEEDYNLMVFVIRMPDGISHHGHLDNNILIRYIDLAYKKIDDFIGEFIGTQKFDNIIIISDHGLKFYDREFNLSRWLEKKGLLFINNSKGNKLYSIVAKLYDFIRPFIKINYKKYFFLKNILLKNILDDSIIIQDKSKKTKIMSFNSNVGGLFLADKDKGKDLVIKEVLEKDKRIFKVISSNIDGFPDLFIILKEKYYFDHHPSLFVLRRRNLICHSQKGFFIASGKEIINRKGTQINYLDVAPTILDMFGLERGEHMKGRPLKIFKKE